MKVQNPAILIVEDDPNDQFFIEDAIRRLDISTPIIVLNNGVEAIKYLDGEGEYSDRRKFPFPTTVITDLKMPFVDGFGVLRHLKDKSDWGVVPTVVLSGSSDLHDIKTAYRLGASAYHLKPSNPTELRRLIKLLHDYWLVCEVPLTDIHGTQLQTEGDGKLADA